MMKKVFIMNYFRKLNEKWDFFVTFVGVFRNATFL